MTKTITALATLQLIEKERLGLDDSIDRYIPNNPYGESITIRHLLSQTSGIPNPLKWVHLASRHDNFDEDAALAEILVDNPDLSFEPGEKYAYSNISYWLLGKIIEKVSGQSYPEYVIEDLFAPYFKIDELKTIEIKGRKSPHLAVYVIMSKKSSPLKKKVHFLLMKFQ